MVAKKEADAFVSCWKFWRFTCRRTGYCRSSSRCWKDHFWCFCTYWL